MPREATQYRETIQEDLDGSIQDLDWHNRDNPPIEEAATLVYEKLQYPEPGEKPDLDDILAEVPAHFRNEVMATMLREQIQAQENQATNATTEREQTNFSQPPAHDDQKAAQHPAETGLQHDLERTQHILQYVEAIGDSSMAYQLGKVMEDSRNLELRALNGDITTYGNKPEATHEKYVQCILDLPDTLYAKEAMESTTWNTEQLKEATQHEVNRMAYRLNLEIMDRLTSQISNGRLMANAARQKGMSEDTIQELVKSQDKKFANSERYQNVEYPTQGNIKVMAYVAVIDAGVTQAIKRGDEEQLLDLVQPMRGIQAIENCAKRAASYVDPRYLETIEHASETAAQWNDNQIMDGEINYHVAFADLEFKESNEDRMQWLRETNQFTTRKEITGDCTARAINEAMGGGRYGEFHQTLSDQVQTKFPERDADRGSKPQFYEPIYKENGLQPMLDTQEVLNHLMRKHLDIREIPTLFNHLFDDENPLTYIANSEGHAVTVVDGTVHDIWDSRDMAHQLDKRGKDGTLVELWIKCDDEAKLNATKEILNKYEAVRRYDDVLTHGRKRRENQLI